MMRAEVSALRTPSSTAGRRIRIQRRRGWQFLNLPELWEFRDLLLILAWRDVQLRYKQTALGVVWVVLQALVSSLLFAFIFGRLARLPSDGVPYLLFVFAAILPWRLFTDSLQRGGASLVMESRLVTKIYFPRILIPLASTSAAIIDFAVSAVIMAVLLVLYAVPPTMNLLALPIMFLVLLLVCNGITLIVAALNVYYRDFMYALPFVIQVWLYGSPIVYSTSLVPEELRLVYSLNPLVGIIDGFRWSLLGLGSFPVLSFGVSTTFGLVVFTIAVFAFRRLERHFADRV